MRSEKGDTDNAAMKDLIDEVNKREKRLAKLMQDKMRGKRPADVSSSSMAEETWDRVSLPEDQPTFAVQAAWARIVAEILSREVVMTIGPNAGPRGSHVAASERLLDSLDRLIGKERCDVMYVGFGCDVAEVFSERHGPQKWARV